MNTREGASLGLALSPTLKPAGEPPQSLAGTESPWKPRGLGRGGGGRVWVFSETRGSGPRERKPSLREDLPKVDHAGLHL